MITDIDKVIELFPAPSFRKYQKETITSIAKNFASGVKCVLLDSPTGSGKSPMNITLCRAADSSFYITPQLTLIDQMVKDKIVGPYITDIKGRQNYFCAFDPIATVDVGLCRRIKDFTECTKMADCPYWRQKVRALSAHTAIMSFAYFILEGFQETDYSFGRRELLVLDESHNVGEHVIDHISLTVSPWRIPFDMYQKVYSLIGNAKTMDDAISIIRTVSEFALREMEVEVQTTLEGKELTIPQATNFRRLEEFVSGADRFLNSVRDTEWVWSIGWSSYKSKNYPRLMVQPLYPRTFMADMIWSRANYYIVSSATLLNVPMFVQEVGLDIILKKDEILHLSVPSTFPPENRPILDTTFGESTRMTYAKRQENFVTAVHVLEKILDNEIGKNVAVHCHSYDISIGIMNLIDTQYKLRLISHTSENREEQLELWKSQRGKVFLCVSFEEGQDWVGEICEAQILFKIPYPDVRDKRVSRRLEKRDWKWYYNETLKKTIQSYGRAVRRPEDKARYYVIDTCFVDLIKRCRKDIPEWFYDALPDHWKILVR